MTKQHLYNVSEPTDLLTDDAMFIVNPLKSAYWGYDIKKAEQLYSEKSGGRVQYMGDFCKKLKHQGNEYWTEQPVSIFWQEKPPATYSCYFGLLSRYDNPSDMSSGAHLYITSGAEAFLEPMIGVVADNGEVVVSRYRHDNAFSYDKSVWIDGGRDYVRTGMFDESRFVYVTVDGPNFLYEYRNAESKA